MISLVKFDKKDVSKSSKSKGCNIYGRMFVVDYGFIGLKEVIDLDS